MCYNIVTVGAPIDVEKVENPTQEQIEDLHQNYMKALTELYNTHRNQYAPDPSVDLVIE